MNIRTSLQPNSLVWKARPRQEAATLSAEEPTEKKRNFTPAWVAASSLAAGVAMIFKDDIGGALSGVTDSVTPAIQAFSPILGAAAIGGGAGAVTGALYGSIATSDQADAGSFLALVGGGVGGLALGTVVGGICGACGVTPLLAIPVTVAAGAACSYLI